MHINLSPIAASDTTLQKIECNQIIIKHDKGIETTIKELCGPIYSTTYLGGIKIQLRFPFPWNLHDEPFPNPARQKKMIKEVINYLISENE